VITYLSGAITPELVANDRPDLGIMIQPRMGNQVESLRSRWHAIDNDCFAQGEKFDENVWLAFLDRLRPYQQTALFATAPDVVGNAEATAARSAPYLEVIREKGYPVAFVSQDGCHSGIVPWAGIQCLFVGGSNDWKLSPESWDLCREAKRRGKWVHVGRVNSLKRLRLCMENGVDSADGTFLKYGPKVNWPRLTGWLDALNGVTV
jgi:hypothetical protein